MRPRPGLLVLALVALLVGAGCAKEDAAVRIAGWSVRSAAAPGGTEVTLPTHLDALAPPGGGTMVLHADVRVPEAMRGREMTLAVPYLPARVSLQADGTPAMAFDAEDGVYRGIGPHRFRIPGALTDDGLLALDLIIEHRWTQSAWFDSVPRLSATPLGDAPFLRAQRFNELTGAGAFLTILLVAFSYATIYFAGKRRSAPGWFAVEALSGAMYPAFAMGFTEGIFGIYEVPLLAASLAFAAYASLRFAHEHLKLAPPHRAWAWPVVATAVVAIAAHGPFEATRFAAPLTVGMMLAVALYQLALFVRCVRRQPGAPEVWLIPLSWPFACTLGAADMAGWIGQGELFGGVRAGCMGIGLISIVQSFALSRDYILMLDRADALNGELAGRVHLLEERNQEVQRLNGELRRQIGARSEQLAGALARLCVKAQWRDLAPGEVVEDRYRVVRCIGSGATGTVYAVERTGDRRALALKVLRTHSGAHELARFAREAQIASQLDHPNVITLVDVDVATSGYLFLVLELVSGGSLRQHKDKYGDVDWALAVLGQIARGLAAMHARGIVHRDLKPANVLVASREGPPRIKITDFGISARDARDADEPPPASSTPAIHPPSLSPYGGEDDDDAKTATLSRRDLSLTATGLVLGTPHYMAPEIAGGARKARPAADMFGFGVMAFELLTGRLPTSGAPLCLRMHEGDASPAPSFADACPSLDRRLAALLDACLSAAPDERPRADALADALQAFETMRAPALAMAK